MDGLKTGFTDNAKYCMAVTAKRDGMRLLAIVLGEETGSVRNQEISELLDYGFKAYKVNNFMNKDSVVDEISLEKATKDKVKILFQIFIPNSPPATRKPHLMSRCAASVFTKVCSTALPLTASSFSQKIQFSSLG